MWNHRHRVNFQFFGGILFDISPFDHAGVIVFYFVLCLFPQLPHCRFPYRRAMWPPFEHQLNVIRRPVGATINWAAIIGVPVQKRDSIMVDSIWKLRAHEAKMRLTNSFFDRDFCWDALAFFESPCQIGIVFLRRHSQLWRWHLRDARNFWRRRAGRRLLFVSWTFRLRRAQI